MNTRVVYLIVILLLLALPALSQEPAPQQPAQDAAAKEKEESAKRLADIGKVQDAVKRKELLQKYIQDYPKASNINGAYSRLLSTLYPIDIPGTIALADEILAKPREPKSMLWKTAYTFKFFALQKQISELGNKILETETDPGILQRAGDYDKEHSSKLFEKAIAERKANPKSEDPDPTLDDIHFAYSRKLREQGKKDEALREQLAGVELAHARVVEMEALPKDDPKRRNLVYVKESLVYSHKDLATLHFETGDPQKGLDALVKAEQYVGSPAIARQLRPSIEETRANIYSGMGKTEEALESYTRSFSSRMSLPVRDKIQSLASKTGKPASHYFTRARELRQASAEPLTPFSLKTDDGKPATLESLKGKVTLVNFFFPT